MTPATITVVPVGTEERLAWEQTRAELLGFVGRRVESRDAAEDIVQDVLERVQRTDLSQIASVQAWLYRAARNAIVDHYRRRREHVSLDQGSGWPDEAETGVGTAEPDAAVRELAQCLRPLIERLPDDYRSAVVMVDLDGQTHDVAARAAGVSTSGM